MLVTVPNGGFVRLRPVPLTFKFIENLTVTTMIADAPLLQTRVGCTALGVLLCLGIGLRLANLRIVAGRSRDETSSTRQASLLLRDGTAGLSIMAAEYESDPASRIAGPATRAGYFWMLATTMRLTGK